MPFRTYTLFIEVNDKVKDEINNDPVLSRNFYWLKNPIKNAFFPDQGLYLINGIVRHDLVDYHHQIPWDAIWTKKRYNLKFPDLRGMPPKRMLERMVEIYEKCEARLFYYEVEIHGGETMNEYVCIVNEDHYFVRGRDDEPDEAWKNGEPTEFFGNILRFGLVKTGVKTKTGWFEPFAGKFDWDKRRVSPRYDSRDKLYPFPTSLYKSVLLSNHKSVEYCLENDIKPENYHDIVNVAAKRGDVKILQMIIKYGGRINNSHWNPIKDAVNCECVEALIEAGAKIKDTPSTLKGVLKAGNNDGIKLLLSKNPMPEMKDGDLWFAACRGGVISFADKLLKHIDVNFRDIGYTGLELAAENNRLDMVRWLLKKGASNSGEALVSAAKYNSFDVVKWLIEENNTDVNSYNVSETALFCASKNGNLKMVNYLLKKGADPLKKTRGEVPLNTAAAYGRNNVITRLLEAGVDVDADRETTYTPLWSAISHSYQDTVDLLIENGASLDFKNSRGYSIIDWAKDHNIKLD
ncbi:MAG: ankyrin repeat domain-containing protein [Deltaproteobacteria bacterium]|nr:ankyrin repeat domain-containing protein [Deltaproteobacteria bacterium]